MASLLKMAKGFSKPSRFLYNPESIAKHCFSEKVISKISNQDYISKDEWENGINFKLHQSIFYPTLINYMSGFKNTDSIYSFMCYVISLKDNNLLPAVLNGLRHVKNEEMQFKLLTNLQSYYDESILSKESLYSEILLKYNRDKFFELSICDSLKSDVLNNLSSNDKYNDIRPILIHYIQEQNSIPIPFLNFILNESSEWNLAHLLNDIMEVFLNINRKIFVDIGIFSRFVEKCGGKAVVNSVYGGKCQFCLGNLTTQTIKESDFSFLIKDWIDNVMEQNNTHGYFRIVQPEKVNELLSFLKKRPKYDLIFDLANLTGVTDRSWMIKSIMKHNDIKRILAISRNRKVHLNRFKHWKTVIKTDKDLRNITLDHFTTDIKEDDDTLMILAALVSGPSCHIISHDKFQAYLPRLLYPESQEIFKAWRVNNVYDHNFQDPIKYDTTKHSTHYNSSTKVYHVPFLKLGDCFQCEWMCIKMP